jgi:CheY-like chemotaxis protein
VRRLLEQLLPQDHSVTDYEVDVVSDIEMPEEDGFSLIRRVRERPRQRGGHTPAIALSAYARDQDRNRALATGYQVHLAKPAAIGQVISAIADGAPRP